MNKKLDKNNINDPISPAILGVSKNEVKAKA